MMMPARIILFSESKTQNYMSLYSHYQQIIIKIYKNLKGQCNGMNVKQKVRVKIVQMSSDIFSH